MKYLRSLGIVTTLLIVIGFLSACNGSQLAPQARPAFPDLYHPSAARIIFKDSASIPPLAMNIDNVKMRIYNPQYMPYLAKYDSAHLQMTVSSELDIAITNLKTGSTVKWNVTTNPMIDVSGGRLKIDITRNRGKESKTLTYQLYIQTYGYNPNKLQWKPRTTHTPIKAATSKVYMIGGKRYWLASTGSECALYEITALQPMTFEMKSANIPATLRPETVIKDHRGGYWAIDKSGMLHHSMDLMAWTAMETAGTQITAIAYDRASDPNADPEVVVIGMSSADQKYYTYTTKGDILMQGSPVGERFPISGSYYYTFENAGTISAYLFGGETAMGEPVQNNYFTSDGINWAPMPVNVGEQIPDMPLRGALYLREGDTIFMMTGEYESGPSANMLVSRDRGLTWHTLSKNQAPGEDFLARTGAAGFIVNDGTDNAFYILSGIVNNQPSDEIWEGAIDKTGGIINSIDEE